MGDARHKKSPPSEEEGQEVTPGFRLRVFAQLEANRKINETNGIGRRDPNRLIDDHASLARAVDTDTTQINNILGPVRPTSKPKPLVGHSVFVRRIEKALGLEPFITIEIPVSQLPRIQKVIRLGPSDATKYESALDSVFKSKQA
jgi:hypothetical protein